MREISRCNAKVLRQPCPDIAILKDSDAAVSHGFESVVGRCSVDLKACPDFRRFWNCSIKAAHPNPRLDCDKPHVNLRGH